MTLPTRLPPGGAVVRQRGPADRRLLGVPIVGALFVEPRLLVLFVGFVAVGLLRRLLQSRRSERSRHAQIANDLPSAVALLHIAAVSGHGPRAAAGLVGAFGEGVIAQELAVTASRLRQGADLHHALAGETGVRATASWIRLSWLMERADHEGSAWGPGLEVLAADVHRQRVSRLDEDGHRLTVGLLFPLVLCVLPAFVLLALVPLLADTLLGVGL